MPRIQSLLRLAVAAGLWYGFYDLPRLLPKIRAWRGLPAKTEIGMRMADVRRITITGFARGPLKLKRISPTKWTEDNAAETPADSDRIEKILADFHEAELKIMPKSAFNPTGFSLTLSTLTGQKLTIELGKSTKPFRQQIIRINSRTLQMDRDVNVCLGLWPSERPTHKTLLADSQN